MSDEDDVNPLVLVGVIILSSVAVAGIALVAAWLVSGPLGL